MFWLVTLGVVIVAGIIIALLYRRHARELTEAHERLQTVMIERDQCQKQAAISVRHQQIIHTLIEDALVIVNPANMIVDCNSAAKALSPRCVPGLSLIAAFRLHELEALLRDARSQTNDILPMQLTFNERLYRVTCRTLGDVDQNTAIALRDISELQRLGHARRDFIANLSHELRTPLASIRLLVDSLQRHPLANPDQQNMLDQIGDQTDSLVQIAQEMFDLSLIESGRLPMRLKPTDLHDIAATVCTRLQTQASRGNLVLQNEVPTTLQALVDPVQLERVLTNLAHNAIKFTPSGSVTLGISTDQPPPALLGDEAAAAWNPVEWVTLFVRDTGVGIPKYEQNRIFERFYKLDRVRGVGNKAHHGKSGTGLGLAIAKHIVEAHGGHIWVRSAEGKGATFYLTVPTVDG